MEDGGSSILVFVSMKNSITGVFFKFRKLLNWVYEAESLDLRGKAFDSEPLAAGFRRIIFTTFASFVIAGWDVKLVSEKDLTVLNDFTLVIYELETLFEDIVYEDNNINYEFQSIKLYTTIEHMSRMMIRPNRIYS